MVDFENDIKKCIETMERGGTILYPTDTVWGIGCDALNEAAVDKVFALKNRPKEKSVIVLLADARDILQYIAAPPPDIIAMVEAFEQPTTVIFNGALGFAPSTVNTDGSIAIRVTTDPFCKALIKRFRKPIVSTSANISGQPTPAIFPLINGAIVSDADYVVKYRQNDTSTKAPSKLIRITDEGEVTVLRP
jgi:L-threonylcarbamoyladenylate synthase